MIGVLLAFHPRRWRATYGDGYRALLEQTRMTPSVVLDVLGNAAKLHLRAHVLMVDIVVAAAITTGIELFAVREHVTDNILWAPTDPLRTVALAVVLAPLVVVGTRIAQRRRTRPLTSTFSR